MLPWWSSDYFILFFSGVRKFRVRREWYSTRKYLCLVIIPTLFSTRMLIHTDTHTFQIHSNCKDPWHVFHIMFLIVEQKTNSILKSYKLFSSSIILIWVSLTLTQKVEGQDDNHSHYKYIVRVFKIMICEANLLSTLPALGSKEKWYVHPTDSFLHAVPQWDVSSKCVSLYLGFMFSRIHWQCVAYVECRE